MFQNPFAIPLGGGDIRSLMQSPNTTDPDYAPANPPVPALTEFTAPDTSEASEIPQPIGVLAVRPDFPQCALGALVDFQGFIGIVTEIVNQSIRVRSSEGITQRFNTQRLKTLFAPPEHIKPAPSARPVPPPDADSILGAAARSTPAISLRQPRPEPAAPVRVYIADPDFTTPVLPINTYAVQPDFPKCAYGKHVDIVGYSGVVVEIVRGSLKVQAENGATRSYNAVVLKSLYGQV